MKGDLLRRGDLSDSTKAEMYSLFCSQFENVPLERFISDLDEKNWVLQLRNDDGELAAFSSMHVYEAKLNGRKMTLLYSGDTAVDRMALSPTCVPPMRTRGLECVQSPPSRPATREGRSTITNGRTTHCNNNGRSGIC